MKYICKPAPISVLHIGAASLFVTIYHILLSPIFHYLDAGPFANFRGPVFEELYKYIFIYFILRDYSSLKNSIAVGIAVGISETVINTVIVFHEMRRDIMSSFPELSDLDFIFWLCLGIFIKLLMSCVAHFIVTYAGLRIFPKKIFLAFTCSVFLHFLFNQIISG